MLNGCGRRWVAWDPTPGLGKSFCAQSLLSGRGAHRLLEAATILQACKAESVCICHSLRSYHDIGLPDPWKWKWKLSNGVGKSEMSIIWCISITNNVIYQTKNSMKQLKWPTALISHWFSVVMVQNGPKLYKRDFLYKKTEIFRETWPDTGNPPSFDTKKTTKSLSKDARCAKYKYPGKNFRLLMSCHKMPSLRKTSCVTVQFKRFFLM